MAQGSTISPALFNIYAEELLLKLFEDGWSLEDLLAFADDHLFICDTLDEIVEAIKLTDTWCNESNIKLNPSKSGILEVVPRRSKPILQIGTSIQNVPVVNSYKYLGLTLDNKLTGDKHIAFMNMKINFLNHRLAPLLRKVSVDYRINLWKILVRPLYNPLLAMMLRNNQSRIIKTERNLKMSLKKFAGLTASTPDPVLRKLIDFNMPKLAIQQEKIATMKWNSRCLRTPFKMINSEN